MQFRLHTFQRIAGFVCSVALLAFAVVAIANGMQVVGKGGVPVPFAATVFVVIVSVAIGSLGIWLTAFTRHSPLDELQQTSEPPSHDLSPLSKDSIACQFSLGSKIGGVFVDTDSEQIHFSNCHMKYGFTNAAAESFQCSIADVMRVHDKHVYKIGMCLLIVTRYGRCMIRKIDADYAQVRDALVGLVPVNDPGYILQDPSWQMPLGFLIASSGVMGLLTGWWLLPAQASDTWLAIYLIAGTSIGIAGSLLMVALVDRRLRAGSRQQV